MFYSTKSSWFLTGIDGCLCWYDRPRGYCFVALLRMIKATRGWMRKHTTRFPRVHFECSYCGIHVLGFIYLHVLIFIYSFVLPYIMKYTVQYTLCYEEGNWKSVEGRIVSPPQPIICFVGGPTGFRRGQHFYSFFSITEGSRNEILVLKEADCINFVQIQFGLGTLLM